MEKDKSSDPAKEDERREKREEMREEREEKREEREEKREEREEHKVEHPKKMESQNGTENMLPVISILISIVAILLSSYSILRPVAGANSTTTIPLNVTTTAVVSGYNIQSPLIQPESVLSDSPVITQNQTFGARLTNINAPLNATELGIINNAPNAYFETAGEMFLNHSLKNYIGATPKSISSFVVNGKPTVIYFGSTTCIFCAENRWAMAMALSRFGNFSMLFKGYSALQDSDLPTLFWAPAHYNASSSTSVGDFYSGKYINFIAIEDSGPITGGFTLSPMDTIQSRINSTGNTAYIDAMKYIVSTGDLRGTPFTVWGTYEIGGVDAVILGNTTPKNNTYPIEHMTHEQVLKEFATPKDQFGWSEYAAADLYVAMVCKTLDNKAPVCSLAAIQGIESQLGS